MFGLDRGVCDYDYRQMTAAPVAHGFSEQTGRLITPPRKISECVPEMECEQSHCD